MVLFLMVLDCSVDHVNAFSPINTTVFSNGYYGYGHNQNDRIRSSFSGPITKYSISERSETGKNI